jgi:hypothetical protein
VAIFGSSCWPHLTAKLVRDKVPFRARNLRRWRAALTRCVGSVRDKPFQARCAHQEKPSQKKWPLRGAAKFREETPRKGGGLAIEIAIPRCNNMPKPELVCKMKVSIFRAKGRRNIGKNRHPCLYLSHMLPS